MRARNATAIPAERLQPPGLDLIALDEDTVVCDLNAGEFPTEAAAQADIIVMLGVLETIVDVDSFFTHLRFCKRDLILSYCATDLTGNCDRGALGWFNHFSYFDLARLFDRFGFRIACTAPIDSAQALMRLTPAERLKPLMPCSVAVVSDAGADPFGRRLGLTMINALLPGEAEVHHLSFGALGEARAHYDLVVLGTGDSLFQPLIGRRRARSARPRQGLDRHLRDAVPRVDPAARARAGLRPARHLVRALRGRRAQLRARAGERRASRRLAD